jgi:hypothetical protein
VAREPSQAYDFVFDRKNWPNIVPDRVGATANTVDDKG